MCLGREADDHRGPFNCSSADSLQAAAWRRSADFQSKRVKDWLSLRPSNRQTDERGAKVSGAYELNWHRFLSLNLCFQTMTSPWCHFRTMFHLNVSSNYFPLNTHPSLMEPLLTLACVGARVQRTKKNVVHSCLWKFLHVLRKNLHKLCLQPPQLPAFPTVCDRRKPIFRLDPVTSWRHDPTYLFHLQPGKKI